MSVNTFHGPITGHHVLAGISASDGAVININFNEGIKEHTFRSYERSLTEKRCLQSLAFVEMDIRSHDIGTAEEGTCKWLLVHHKYRKWRSSDRGLLWIQGKPGSGKSTLLRYALTSAELVDTTNENTLVLSFFFHGRGVKLQHTPLGFFRAVLHQVLRQAPSSLSGLVDLFQQREETMGQSNEKWYWQLDELRDFLRDSLSRILQVWNVWMFVDAIDEGGRENSIALVKYFKSLLYGLPDAKCTFHICFTCRHYPILESCEYEICLENQNKEDISIYVKNRLAYSRTLTHSEIPTLLTQRARGVFLWVRLVVDRVILLESEGDGIRKIEKAVNSIPEELDELYHGLVKSMDKKGAAFKLIQWILLAFQPLTLSGLRWALVMDAQSSNTTLLQWQGADDYTPDDASMQRKVRALSRGLAEVVCSSGVPIVQFIHQSVNDFFHEKGLLSLVPTPTTPNDESCRTNHIIGMSHHLLSMSCIKYLATNDITELGHVPESTYAPESTFPFLAYALEWWAEHASQAEARGIRRDDILQLFSWPKNDILEQWARIYHRINIVSHDAPSWLFRGTTLLYVASQYQLITTLQTILERADQFNMNLNTRDIRGQTALWHAAHQGHSAIVQILLAINKVDATIEDYFGMTPLHAAAKNGSKIVASLLLDVGYTNINARNHFGQTPLQIAAERGHEGLVKLLISKGADPDTADNMAQTPLHSAASYGNLGVVRMILGTGKANILQRNADGRTARWLAACYGHETTFLSLPSTEDLDYELIKGQSPRQTAPHKTGLPKTNSGDWWSDMYWRDTGLKNLLEYTANNDKKRKAY